MKPNGANSHTKAAEKEQEGQNTNEEKHWRGIIGSDILRVE